MPLGGSGVRTDGDAGRRQPRPGTPPVRRRRQQRAIRTQEPESPCGVGDHLKALLVHRAAAEAAAEHQIGELRRPAVGPVHYVIGVAAAGAAAGELALVAIPALEGTAQRGRDGAGPASHVEHAAVGAVAQHHEAGIAGDAVRRLFADVDTPCLSMTAWPGAAAVGPPPRAAAARWRPTAGSMGAWPAAASAAGAAGSIARVSAEISGMAGAALRQPRVSAATCIVTWKRWPGLP